MGQLGPREIGWLGQRRTEATGPLRSGEAPTGEGEGGWGGRDGRTWRPACGLASRAVGGGVGGAWPRFPPNLGYVSPKCILMYFAVFFVFAEQRHVSTCIEEATQIHTKKTDTYQKKTPCIGHVSGPAIHVFACIRMYSRVFACIRIYSHMYRDVSVILYVSVMYGLGSSDFPQMWGCIPPNVFCSI